MWAKKMYRSNLFSSFAAAGSGILQAIRQEPHLRFHLTAAAFVLYFQRYFALKRSELALLLLTIALVISAELVNTAIERTVDLCCPQRNPLAKLAKDAAAGAVLVNAIASVGVGLLLFWKPQVLYQLLRDIFSSPARTLLLLAALVCAGCFILFFTDRSAAEKKKNQDC